MSRVELQESLTKFFKSAVELFQEFRWIYDFKATDILKDDVRGKVPACFKDFFQSLEETDKQFHDILNLEGDDDDRSCWPPELKRFVISCRHLRHLSEEIKRLSIGKIDANVCHPDPSQKLPRKWNPKKYFEVVHVGNFVGHLCVREGCDAAVDIGSGLGYLSSHLANQFRIPVVGIESVASRVDSAQKTYLSNSSVDSVTQNFVCLRITENISEELEPHISDYEKVCLTALHACGDLTPWALKYFVSVDTCKCVAVVPCCYHKMEVTSPNFPMSCGLKGVISRFEDQSFLKNTWLWRLACQRAGCNFLGDIEKETKNWFYRALLEKYSSDVNVHLSRKKRNLQDSKFKTFTEYLEKIIGPNGGFSLVSDRSIESEIILADALSRLNVLHDEFIDWSRIITGILAMQGALQAIAEDLILLDRLSFLLESDSVGECGIIKVIPDSVSPRGIVIFGIKK